MDLIEHKIDKFEFVQPEDSPHYFSDIIEVKVVDDRISLKFGIKDVENQKANVSHTVFLTLGHFIRFTDVCTQTSKLISQNIERFSKTKK